MNLVEAEATGPIEGEDAIVTPPRPPHRRVSVSLLFTVSVLVGTVVTIYSVFPPEGDLAGEALAAAREGQTAADVQLASPGELRAWMTGVIGEGAPLPPASVHVLSARRVRLVHHDAALLHVRTGDVDATYVVQTAREGEPARDVFDAGDLRAIAWRAGGFACAAVGPAASADRWQAAIRASP
jgi:hypothetical protein